MTNHLNDFRSGGFAPLLIVVVITIVLAAAGGGYWILKKTQENSFSPVKSDLAPAHQQEVKETAKAPESKFTPKIAIKEEDIKSTTPLPVSSVILDPKSLLGIWKVEKIFTATPEGTLKEFSMPLPLFTQFRETDLCRQWEYTNNEGVCQRYDLYSVQRGIITTFDPQEGSLRWEWQIKDEKLELTQRLGGKVVAKTVSFRTPKVAFELSFPTVQPPKPQETALSPSALLGEWRLEQFLNYDSAAGQWKSAQGTATEFQEFFSNTMCNTYSTLEFASGEKKFSCLGYAPYTVTGDVIAMEAYDLFSKSKTTAYYRWNIVGGKLELSVGISETPFLKYVYHRKPPPPLPMQPFVLAVDDLSPRLGAFKEARIILASAIKTTDLVHLWVIDGQGSKLFLSDSTIFCEVSVCTDPGGTVEPDSSNPKCPFNTKTITDRFGKEKKISDGICFTPAVWGESGKLESKFSVPIVFKEVGTYTVHAKLFTSGLAAQITIGVQP